MPGVWRVSRDLKELGVNGASYKTPKVETARTNVAGVRCQRREPASPAAQLGAGQTPFRESGRGRVRAAPRVIACHCLAGVEFVERKGTMDNADKRT